MQMIKILLLKWKFYKTTHIFNLICNLFWFKFSKLFVKMILKQQKNWHWAKSHYTHLDKMKENCFPKHEGTHQEALWIAVTWAARRNINVQLATKKLLVSVVQQRRLITSAWKGAYYVKIKSTFVAYFFS